MLVWDDSYSTGIEEIDAQHEILFKFVNSLERLIQEGNKSRERIEHALDFLENYCKTHFQNEEKCMTERKCPIAAHNKAAHDKFIEFYEQFKQKFHNSEDPQELLREIHSTTHDWLLSHIGKVDVHLRGCANP